MRERDGLVDGHPERLLGVDCGFLLLLECFSRFPEVSWFLVECKITHSDHFNPRSDTKTRVQLVK